MMTFIVLVTKLAVAINWLIGALGEIVYGGSRFKILGCAVGFHGIKNKNFLAGAR